MMSILNTENLDITPEMEAYFKGFVEAHRAKVVHYAKLLLDRRLITQELFAYIKETHDMSKFKEPEYTPYVRRKWLERNSGKDFYDDMGDDVKGAIVHHVTTNAHHPEYWSDDYKGFASSQPCHVDSMPEFCIVEMICDWEAMASEKGNTAWDWYIKTSGNRWVFDEVTARNIEKWIHKFEEIDRDETH